MFEYPIEKYKFYTAKKIDGQPYKVIAVSTYEGKMVRGVAKCDTRDTFDMELGKQLAAARCNQKIAQKRQRRADRELKKAVAAFDKAQKHMFAMNDYYEDARSAAKTANSRVNTLLKTM